MIIFLIADVVLAAKFLLSFFLVIFLLICLYNIYLEYIRNQSRIKSHRQFDNLSDRELAMRINRYLPGCRVSGFSMLTEDVLMSSTTESDFEEYIASRWHEQNYFTGMAAFARPRFFLGIRTSGPTDQQIYEFHRDNYGLNEIRDDHRGRYYGFLKSQQFVRRDAYGRVMRENTNFNEERLRELLGEDVFQILAATKRERTQDAHPNEHTAQWEFPHYLNPEPMAERSEDYEPDFEFGNEDDVFPIERPRKMSIPASQETVDTDYLDLTELELSPHFRPTDSSPLPRRG